MSTRSLSAGQAQVREIAAQVLEEFSIDPLLVSETHNAIAYSTLLTRMAQDASVRDDPYTGCRIVEKEVANSYIDWLMNQARATDELLPKQLLPIDFNRMAFLGSVAGSWDIDPERKVYQGGVRATVTARAVLTLAKGNELYSDEFEISYLTNSRIMQITGGNHRLLAYKLLGIAEFPTDKLVDHQVTLYKDLPDEQLNQALLRLESLYLSHDPRENTIRGVRGQEALVMQLAADYGASSTGAASSGLYDFVKADLARLRLRSRNYFGHSTYHNPTLADFADYAKAYQYFMGFTSQSWLRKLVKGRGPAGQLSASQKEIHERLATWSSTGSNNLTAKHGVAQ